MQKMQQVMDKMVFQEQTDLMGKVNIFRLKYEIGTMESIQAT